jgi:mannose-6-phosphate isomerase
VHALGAETVIFEIQQNSDTTYRVFDWNRVDRNGQPRELHVPQSLASIDFADFEPVLLPRTTTPANPGTVRPLVKDALFEVALRQLDKGDQFTSPAGRMEIFGVVKGMLRIEGSGETIEIGAGHFCLIPAQCQGTVVHTKESVTFLEIQ